MLASSRVTNPNLCVHRSSCPVCIPDRCEGSLHTPISNFGFEPRSSMGPCCFWQGRSPPITFSCTTGHGHHHSSSPSSSVCGRLQKQPNYCHFIVVQSRLSHTASLSSSPLLVVLLL